MSQAAPIPARFYPAGGDAHGHPALVELVGDVLQVLPADSPPRQVPLTGLQAATRGFNHSQWAIAWPAESGGQHMLLIDEAAVGPLRAVAPALFAGGEGVRRRSSRRFLVGITLLALVPLLVVVALLASLDHLTDRVVARIPPSVERQIGAAVLARTRLEGRLIDQGPAFEAVQAIGRRLARPGETLEFHLAERPGELLLDLLPLITLVIREEGVSLHRQLNMGQIETIGARQSLGVQLTATDDHHLLAVGQHRQRSLQRRSHIDACRLPLGIAADHQIPPTRQRTANRFKGAAPHHHRLTHGDRLEVAQIGRQMPRHRISAPNHALFSHGDNQ